ncbi:MAG: LysM peptidoglycan-binding domain-containing protein [Chloroflexi bacterium]|nr:LysM peptidoglycan-binding domain-containing protein [Chloroflexota bacterium]
MAAAITTPTPASGIARLRGELDPNDPESLRVLAAETATAQAGSAANPTPAPTPTPPPEPSSVVVYHEVKPGDTLNSIAGRYGVSVRTILSINEVIQDQDVLKVGLQLYIPTKDGVVTFVRGGDTVSELAEKFSVKPEDIVNFKANGLADADSIREGELILIPGGKAPAPPPRPPPPPAPARVDPPAPAPAVAEPPRAAQPAPTQRVLLVRVLHGDRPRRRHADNLRALQLATAGPDRPEGGGRTGGRLRRHNRLLHRCPPALRDPQERCPRQPARPAAVAGGMRDEG